jgi:hypothetical protein
VRGLVSPLLVGSPMNKMLQLFATSILLTTGCVATQDANETAGADEQGVEGFIGPGESCQLDVDLSCPDGFYAEFASDGESTMCVNAGMSEEVRQIQKRPDDVVAINGGTLVRGYDLRGDALTRACYDVARLRCSAFAPDFFCQDDLAEECIHDFSLNDPCAVGQDFPQPR